MDLKRRALLKGVTAAASGLAWTGLGAVVPLHERIIPSDNGRVPLVGLGSWLTFDAPPEAARRRETCTEVMQAFFEAGGGMIDSSPMYGFSQDVIGAGLRALDHPHGLFSATKVWIPGAALGERQTGHSREIWGVERLDLVHVHNMLDWQSHLQWLRQWRDEGKVRYIGITTSHGRRHEEMEEVIRKEDFDFVQFTYNIVDLEAEQRLLPLAREHGKAVVINRPFRGGALFPIVEGKPLPDWAGEIDCSNWAQFFLKFVVSHPAVSCAIPATSQVAHVRENMAVLHGQLPGPEQRREMLNYFQKLY